jgi:hypothetical protein
MVGSSKDLITDGVNGFTYPFNDSEALALHIKQSCELIANDYKSITETILSKWGYAQMWSEIKTAALKFKIKVL